LGALVSSFAAQTPPNAAKPRDRCEYLASFIPGKMAVAMKDFNGKFFDKYAEFYTEDDYRNLLNNIRPCDGLPANVAEPVNFRAWEIELNDVYRENARTNAMAIAIKQAYEQPLSAFGEMPGCALILKWTRDDLWFTNNSEELFGTAFKDMPEDRLRLLKGFAEECRPVLRQMVLTRQLEAPAADSLVNSIVDSIERDGRIRLDKDIDITPALRLRHNGEVVPMSYLRMSTQNVIKKITLLDRKDTVMPTNTLINISQWAAQVDKEQDDGPDRLYARAVKKIVSEHMFRTAEQMKSRGD
jgi:hypothetical protein